MSKFRVIREFKLNFLGKGWENCYLKFEAFTYKELAKLSELNIDVEDPEQVTKATKRLMEILEEKFVEGRGVGSDGKEVPIEKKDLGDLPLEVITKAVNFLTGMPSPNA